MQLSVLPSDLMVLVYTILGLVLTYEDGGRVSANPTMGHHRTKGRNDHGLLGELASFSNVLRLRKIGNISNRLNIVTSVPTRMPTLKRQRCIERRDNTESLMDYLRVAQALMSNHLVSNTADASRNSVTGVAHSLFLEMRSLTKHINHHQSKKYEVTTASRSQTGTCLNELSAHLYRLTKAMLASRKTKCHFYPIQHTCKKFLRSCNCTVRRI